jgi:hypothetical protein
VSGAAPVDFVLVFNAGAAASSSATTSSFVNSSVKSSSSVATSVAVSSKVASSLVVSSSSAPASSSAKSSSSAMNTAGVIFSENFEGAAINTQPAGWNNLIGYIWNGNNSVTNGNYALIDNAKAYSGTNSIHFKGSFAQIVKPLPPGTNRLYIRAYVNMAKQMGSQPGDNHEHIMGIKATPDANKEIRVGQIKGHLGTNEVPTDNISPLYATWGTGPIISANAWHCVESSFLGDTAYNELRMYVDGVLVHSITSNADWNNGAMPNNWMNGFFNYVELGFQSYSNNSTDVWMDNIVVSTQPIGCGI